MAYRRSISLVSRLAAIISPVWAFVATVPKMSMTAKGAANPAFTLYTSDNCPYAQRTWITARELGVPVDYKFIELGKDNREDWFLKLNPLGKVPTILRGDDVVYESLVANEYLVEVFPPGGEYATPPLLPSSPVEKAKSRIIAARCNDLVTAYFGYLSNKNEEQEATKREKFEKELRMLNDWAAAGAKDGEECGWLCGEYMTLADIAYFPFLERIDATLDAFKGWSLGEIGVPAIMAWMNKCRAKESVAGTLKDPTEWVELYKKFLGIDYFVRAGVVQE